MLQSACDAVKRREKLGGFGYVAGQEKRKGLRKRRRTSAHNPARTRAKRRNGQMGRPAKGNCGAGNGFRKARA